MKQKINILVFFITVLFCQFAFAGPFGLSMGMGIKQIDANAEQIAPWVYLTSKVPKTHSAFEEYALKVGPKSGLCWIKAIGKDISTNSYGSGLKIAFEKMQEKLTNIYGIGETTDMLLSGSILNKPRHWLMAVFEKERFLTTVWDKSTNSTLNNDLTTVYLLVSSSGINEGRLQIEYIFSNEDACEKEIAAQEDGAL